MKYQDDEPKTLVAAEPDVAYGSLNYFALARLKISKDYIKRVIKMAGLSLTEAMDILPISLDTYKRKTSFNPAVTEKVLEIEEVYKEGVAAFGPGFHAWMDTENPAMGGIKPKALLSNSFGVRRLLEQIGRMKHGVLA